MKKILFVVLAAVGLASCVQTEELGVANNKEAIGFDTFVDNATKTLYDNSNLDHFKVYGTISQNGSVVTNIFPGVVVSKPTGVWAYGAEHTQYWVSGFVYDFAAVVDATVAQDANGMPETLSTNLQEQKDVLYATVSDKEYNGGQAEKVSFNFAHLLSKAKFTVKNTISEGQNFVYNIESVKITNAYETAEYNVANEKWTGAGDYDADFEVNTAIAQNGETSSKDILLVPGTKELAIAIKYNLTYTNLAGTEATLVNTTKNLTAVLTLEQGKAYNFIVEFGNPGEEIEFEAVVDGWGTGNLSEYILEADGFGKEVNTGIYHIQNLAGLKYFAAQVNGGRSFEGQTVVLDNDIDISATRSLVEWAPIGTEVANCFEGTFDGQGHTIKNFQVTTPEGHAGLFGYARATFKNLTIENVKLVAKHYAGALVGQGYVKIDSCHAKNVNITLSTKDNDWGDKAGGIVGQLLEGATLGIQESTVENITIKGYRDLGGVAGMAHDNNFVKNCSATNVTIIHDLTDGYQSAVPETLGGVVGRYGSNVTYDGCTEENFVIASEVYTVEELASANTSMVILAQDITCSATFSIVKDIVIDLNGKVFAIDDATACLNIGDKNNTTKPNVTIKGGNLNCKVYALSGEVVIKDVVFGGTIAWHTASQGVINTKHASLLMENCKMTNVKKSGSPKPRSLSIESRSSGYLILRECNFKNSNLDRPYINYLNGNTTLELTNCALYSMASNIMLGGSYSWTNMNLTGCSGGFTFDINRASTSLTDEEMAVYKAIKQNNKGSMRFIFTDGEKNYL